MLEVRVSTYVVENIMWTTCWVAICAGNRGGVRIAAIGKAA